MDKVVGVVLFGFIALIPGAIFLAYSIAHGEFFRTVGMMSIAFLLLFLAIGAPGTSFSREYALLRWNFVNVLSSGTVIYRSYLIYVFAAAMFMLPVYFGSAAINPAMLPARAGSSIIAPLFFLTLALVPASWFLWKLNQMNFGPMVFVVSDEGISRNDNGMESIKYSEIDHIDVFDRAKGAKLEIVTKGSLEYKPGRRGCMVVSAFPQLSALEMATAIAMKSKDSLDGHEIELRMRS